MRKFLILVATLFATSAFAFDIPQSDGKVTDLANVLTSTQKHDLTVKLEKLEKDNPDHPQIGILTIPSLPEDGIEEYANQVFHSWGIGQKGVDNGLLLVVAPNDRKMRLEVGYGLEASIPDSTAQRIIDGMKSDLRAKRYYAAFDGAVNSMVSYLPITHKADAAARKVALESFMSFLFTLMTYLVGVTSVVAAVIWIRNRFRKYPNDLPPPRKTVFIADPEIKEYVDAKNKGVEAERARVASKYVPHMDRINNNGLRSPPAPMYQSAKTFGAGVATGVAAESLSSKKKEEKRKSSYDDDSYSSSSSSWGSSSSSSSSSSSDSGSSWGGGDSGGGGASGDW